MQSLDEGDDFVRICYYGDPGSGKTSAIAGGAHLGLTKVAAAEEGLYAAPLRKLGIPVKNIIPTVHTGYENLMKGAEVLREELHDEPGAWAAWGLDTVTELADQWLADVVDERVDKQVRRAQAAGEDFTKKLFGAERDDYGVITQQFRRVLRAYADLPLHVAYTAHVRRDVDEDSGTVAYGPDLFPKMQAALMGHVSILVWTRRVGEFEDGRPIHVGQTSGTGKYKSKDRLNALPRTLVSPSLDRVVGYIRGELDEKTDPVQLEFQEWKSDNREKKED